MKSAILALAVFLSLRPVADSWALEGQCLSFAFLAEDVADPEALVLSTYGELLDRLGGNLSADALREVAKGDPFDLNATGDRAALANRIRDLAEMIRPRGWIQPNLLVKIKADLVARADGKQRAAVQQAHVVSESWSGYSVALPGSGLALSPDGKSAYTQARRTHSADLHRLDLETGKVDAKLEIPNWEGGVISPDGSLMAFPGHSTVYTVPLAGGKPDLTKKVRLAEPDKGAVHHVSVAFARDPNILYADHKEILSGETSVEGIYRYGLNPATKTQVSFPGGKPKRNDLRSWGVRPDTGELWLLVDHGMNGQKLMSYSVAENGTASQRETRTFRDADTRYVTWSRDGSTAWGYGWKLEYTKGTGMAATIRYADLNEEDLLSIKAVRAHPTEEKMVVLANAPDRSHLYWYHATTGAYLGEVRIPPKSYDRLELTADGSAFVLQGDRSGIYVGNPLKPYGP